MIKNKKRLVMILAIILSLLIIGGVVYGNMDENERRFRTIISEYDKEYTCRNTEYENGDILRCYDLDDAQTGFIVVAQGYNDAILLFVELDCEQVKKANILYHDESEDYGEYVDEDWFLNRLLIPYDGEIETVTVSGQKDNQIVAITGATITSEAVVDAINKCIKTMEEIEDEE